MLGLNLVDVFNIYELIAGSVLDAALIRNHPLPLPLHERATNIRNIVS
jgi:hypothetical protein